MFNVENLIRENIKNLTPYSTARDEYKNNIGIFLDANENAFGSVIENNLNRYPDPFQLELKSKLAKIKRIREDNIFIGNGSDEAIDLIIKTFCEPNKDSILTITPTYGMYKVAADINAIKTVEVPLSKNFEIQPNKILNKINNSTKVIFLCSPNNPTGNLFREKDIKKIISSFHGIVVLDEAYVDFANSKSWIEELRNYDNLIILQTFSKAWGLATIRVGTAFSNKTIISTLNKIKYPYNVNGISQQIVLNALDNQTKKEKFVKKIISERKKLARSLSQFYFVKKIFPSDANFLLVKVENATEIYNYLLNHKIIVRNRSNIPHCNECLRFTVGTKKENEKLIKTLSKYGGETK